MADLLPDLETHDRLVDRARARAKPGEGGLDLGVGASASGWRAHGSVFHRFNETWTGVAGASYSPRGWGAWAGFSARW